MKVYHARYSEAGADTFEDVLVARIESDEEQTLYREHCKMAGEIEWLNRRLSAYDLNDEDIFYYFMIDWHLCNEGAEHGNICEEGDMLVIGKEYE